MTLLLPVSVDLQAVPQIGFVVALAVHDVATGLGAGDTWLKWPNDCLLKGGKLSGILCEVVGDRPLRLALGCGINVSHAPGDLSYPAACLADVRPSISVAEVFASYQRCLAARVLQWQTQGFATIARDWQDRAIGLGEEVRVMVDGVSHVGRFAGLAEDGALLLEGAGVRRFHAGDVTIPALQALRAARA